MTDRLSSKRRSRVKKLNIDKLDEKSYSGNEDMIDSICSSSHLLLNLDWVDLGLCHVQCTCVHVCANMYVQS